MTTADELRRAIVDAFPARPRPLADEVTRAGDSYWERAELRHALKYRTWTTLPHALIRRHRADLIWLAARGFGYYVPAWMLHAVGDAEIRDYVLFALSGYPAVLPGGDRGDGITPDQAATIVAYLDWARSPDADDPLLPERAAAIETAVRTYWSPRAGHGRVQP